MPDFPTLLGAACVAALVVGFLRTSVGGGIGFALAPTLTLVLPAPVVLALIAPLMNLSDPFVLRYFWRRWDAGQLRVLLPTMLAGVVLGAWVLSRLSPFWMEKTIAGIALAFGLSQIVLTGRGVRLMPRGAHWSVGALAGLLAGIASMLAHSSPRAARSWSSRTRCSGADSGPPRA